MSSSSCWRLTRRPTPARLWGPTRRRLSLRRAPPAPAGAGATCCRPSPCSCSWPTLFGNWVRGMGGWGFHLLSALPPPVPSLLLILFAWPFCAALAAGRAAAVLRRPPGRRSGTSCRCRSLGWVGSALHTGAALSAGDAADLRRLPLQRRAKTWSRWTGRLGWFCFWAFVWQPWVLGGDTGRLFGPNADRPALGPGGPAAAPGQRRDFRGRRGGAAFRPSPPGHGPPAAPAPAAAPRRAPGRAPPAPRPGAVRPALPVRRRVSLRAAGLLRPGAAGAGGAGDSHGCRGLCRLERARAEACRRGQCQGQSPGVAVPAGPGPALRVALRRAVPAAAVAAGRPQPGDGLAGTVPRCRRDPPRLPLLAARPAAPVRAVRRRPVVCWEASCSPCAARPARASSTPPRALPPRPVRWPRRARRVIPTERRRCWPGSRPARTTRCSPTNFAPGRATGAGWTPWPWPARCFCWRSSWRCCTRTSWGCFRSSPCSAFSTTAGRSLPCRHR